MLNSPVTFSQHAIRYSWKVSRYMQTRVLVLQPLDLMTLSTLTLLNYKILNVHFRIQASFQGLWETNVPLLDEPHRSAKFMMKATAQAAAATAPDVLTCKVRAEFLFQMKIDGCA